MLAALTLAAACNAAPVLGLVPGQVVSPARIDYFRDDDRVTTLDQVTQAPGCARFGTSAGIPNVGPSRDRLWLRLRIDPARDAGWRLRVPYTGLDRLCVHWPLAGGGFQSQCRAPGQRDAARTGENFIPPVNLDPQQPVYLEGESDLWLKLPLQAGSTAALIDAQHRDSFAAGLYFGFLGTVALIALLAYLARRDRTFLYFSLHIGALTLALLVWQGELSALDGPGFNSLTLAPVLFAMFLAFGSRFYQRFLETRARAPRIVHQGLRISMVLSLLLAVLLPAFGMPIRLMAALGAVALAWVASTTAAGVVRIRQGYRPALTVFGASAVLLASMVFNGLEALDIRLIPASASLLLTQCGLLLAAIFMAIGLFQRGQRIAQHRSHTTQLALANQRMALHRARFDDLTGLPNRTKFEDDLRETLQRTTPGYGYALVTVGMDRFRSINHALGHVGGDAVLAEIAARLRNWAGPEELLARVGPDIFAWLLPLPEIAGIATLQERCAQMRRLLSAPLVEGRGASLGASLGYALYPEHAGDAEALIRASDEALYRAKDQGGGVVAAFEPEMQRQAQRYLDMNKTLREALERKEFALHYQPIVDLESGRLLAAEALLRWKHQGEDIAPDQFLPVAESSELIAPLTDWVFAEACRQMADWRARGIVVPRLAVNVSASQFRVEQFCERVERALDQAGLPGETLTLEITESLLLDNLVAAREQLRRLQAGGVQIAVDDFGIGYSSLSYLRALPVDSIKIDRSFIRGIPSEPEAVSVIRAVIGLGRSLGVEVVAEGIETQAQLDYLQSQGVSSGQGFWLARPAAADVFERWLTEREQKSRAA